MTLRIWPFKKKQKPLDAQEVALLVSDMEAWLRVPKVTYGEWAGLEPDHKAALLIAAKRIKAEETLMLARALTSEDGMLEVGKELDGGQTFLQVQLSKHLDDYEKRVG